MLNINRRTLLRGAAALATTAGTGGAARRRAKAETRETAPAELDVAIVGGGIAGAYCAWRLSRPDAAAALQDDGLTGPPRIALFEMSNRIGGRLWSFVPPGMPHLRAELGGMRIPTDQTIVMSLVEHLGIQTIPFPMGDDHNLRYLRGRRFTVADLANPDIVPYDLPPPYRAKTPDEITIETIEKYLPNASRLSEEEWNEARQHAEFEGIPLHDLGFRYLIERELPSEAFLYIRDEDGFEDFSLSSNAVDEMYELAAGFAADPPVVTPRLGMQEIPQSLADAAARNGAVINLAHCVRRIVPIPNVSDPDPGLRLEIEQTATGETMIHSARHVILAMPPRAISLLAPDSLPLSAPAYRSLESAVIPLAASKIFLGYERPWWRDLGITSGRTISDLPIKVTYYMGTEGEQPGADPDNLSSLLMPSYAEGAATSYWGAFRLQDPDSPGGSPFLPEMLGEDSATLSIPERAVAEFQRQLRLVHGPTVEISEPTMAMMSDWRRDPYGAAYHVWNVGSTAWDMMPLAREPVPGVNLSICGEAWSSMQGWSRGALMSAERLLQLRLGLRWPVWLPPDVDLGP